MKVLLINGSPNEHGCTWTALREVEKTLRAEGIDTELFHIGVEPLSGCTGCNGCYGSSRCIFDDRVNDALEIAEGCDAYVFGAPVHFAGIPGDMKSFLDRFFWAGRHRLKPGAAVVSCRRAGATAALDGLNKYMTIAEMPLVSSGYWNMVHGTNPAEVAQDLEGMQMMRTLGRNMAWLLKSIDAGRRDGLARPETEPRVKTNFVR